MMSHQLHFPTSRLSSQSRRRPTSSPWKIDPCWGQIIEGSSSRTRFVQLRKATDEGIQRK